MVKDVKNLHTIVSRHRSEHLPSNIQSVSKDITIMICTRNNYKILDQTLAAICRCYVPPEVKWEVVLINNNSSDKTAQIAERYSNKLPLIYAVEREVGVSRAKNLGLELAKGKLVIFTDDDVIPSAQWILAYWQCYKQKGEDFYLGGSIESCFLGQLNERQMEMIRFAPLASVRGLNLGTKARILEANENFIGPNWACPLIPLKNAGMFDVQMGLGAERGRIKTGEETELMYRLKKKGLKPWYIPEAKIKHKVPMHKVTMKHISSRIEAGGFASTAHSMAEDNSKLFLGVPRWIYRLLAKRYMGYLFKKSLRLNYLQEYFQFKFLLGMVRGYRCKMNGS